MRNKHRPTGRFFCLLMVMAAPFLAVPAGMLAAPPAGSLPLTQVSDVVYRADGQVAKGTAVISWPAFTTADGSAVAAGSLSVQLGNGGTFSASLAPNTGAQPAGVYYKVVYQLAGQEPSIEYWVVPATGSVSIGSVRAKLMPPTIAAQVLTRDVADANYVHVSGDSAVNGNVTMTGLTAQTINSTVYVQCPNCTDWAAAIQAAYGSCPANASGYKSCQLILPRVDNGPWRSNLTIASPAVSLKGQGRSATTFSCDLAGDCLLYQPNPFTITEGGTFSDFSVTGTGAVGQNLIHVRDSIGAIFERISLEGASAEGSACIWLEDYRGWTERNTFSQINTGYSCAKGWRLSVDAGNTVGPSFGYNKWVDIQGNPNGAGQFFWSAETNAYVYNGTIRTTINKGGNGAVVMHLQDTASINQMEMHLFGEEQGSGGYLWDIGAGSYVKATVYSDGFAGVANNFAGPFYKPDYPYATHLVGSDGNPQFSFFSYPMTFTNGAFSVNAQGQPFINPHYGSANNFVSGYGGNIYWDRTANNWVCQGDGANNGCGLIHFDYGLAGWRFYRGANTGPANQTISTSSLQGNELLRLSANTLYMWPNGAIGVGLLPNVGAQGRFVSGLSTNVQWTGSGWLLNGDGANNGGVMLSGGSGGTFSVFTVPTSGPPSNSQTVTPATMDGYNRFSIDNSGNIKVAGVTVIDSSRNATVQNLTVSGTCAGCAGGPGQEYYASKYGSIQAAIDAAYNNGTVQGPGVVIDDWMAPYSGPGFLVRDSVTLKLAATTYTITGTVSNNNGVANVTAGIISMPGSHIVGAGTSPNHGTNVNAGNGLNADLIATSTVGTGAGANAQWWHWGSIENFHVDGNKANQTAGNCINVENMGETAVLRALELGNCYGSDIKLEGNFATQSEISNITVNTAGQFGVNLDNFEGVGVLRGLSGDSNATSIIRFNGSQSATLTVLGLKSEEEISGHDPLITIDMPADGSQPAFSLVGGYTYARPGVRDVVKVVNGKSGVAPFVTVSNFYVDANFVNAVNDTVNGRTFAAANMNKVPFSYLPTGSYQSGQAFTFAPGTFIQGGNSALTEIFGSSTDGSSMIASQGNGDGTSYYTGGLKIGIPNRTQFGQPPEMMARMGSRFLGAGQGYDANTWVFVPIWKAGDSSNRWIGDPNQRWPEVYASDVNATTATVGTLNVASCVGCGSQHSLTLQGPKSALSGTGSMTALYSVTIPAGTFSVGTGLRCTARSRHTTGTGSVSMGWKLGSTTYTYPTAYTTGTTGGDASIEIFTFASLTAETVNVPWASFGGTTEAPYSGLAWSENVSGAATLQFLFNAASSEKLTGDSFYCVVVQ